MDAQPPPDDSTPRRGRARERQQRRRERRQHVMPASGRSTKKPRQISVPGGFKMPNVNLSQGRNLLYIVGGLLFVIGVIVVLGLFKDNTAPTDPNALWIGTEWTYDNPSNEDVLAFSRRLREHRIGTVYAWVSWLKPDGRWSGRSDDTNEFADVQASVQAFVEQFKLVYPEARLYGWVSVPTDTLGIPARLGEPDVQQAIASFSRRVIDELGFDGVFLNIETVWDGDEDFLAVLRRVRSTLGTQIPISVAVPPDWSPLGVDIPVSSSILPGTAWAKEYKQGVALLVDEIAVMAYNSGLTSVADYAEWMAYQVRAFSQAIDELGTDTDLVIGIPTYDAELPAHDPAVENIPSALNGIQLGLNAAGDAARLVRGLAIYASWETDDDEWAQFQRGWIEG